MCRGAVSSVLLFMAVLAGVGGSIGVASTPVAGQTARSDDLIGSKSRTRFVIGLERTTPFQVSSLPNRVVVDLPEVKVQLPTMSGTEAVGLVQSFRGGLAAPGKMRVIIDVTEPVIVEKAHIEPAQGNRPPRLVLDIVPVAATKKPVAATATVTAAAATVKLAPSPAGVGLAAIHPPMPKPAERPEARAARAYKPVIVLDPGHGGHDSGATRNGAIEKEVVLAFSHALRDKLNATGRYKVLMTRDDDRFIPLADRREFAENNKAALFMAIHADYAGSSAKGATIYSLKDSVANDLKRSAKGEVAQDVLSDKDMRSLQKAQVADTGAVKGILADLAEREVQVTKQRTSVFARSVIDFMGTSTNMMSNPDRSAAFAVLRTAKVPAVLMELAYVSNKEDAAKLKSDAWRNKVADTIVTAIDNYFSNQVARLPM